MCCFSPLVNSGSWFERLFLRSQLKVAGTNIFARKLDVATQLLVYAMQVETPSRVAMILPLPVAPEAGEGALESISVEGCSDFFGTLAGVFEPLPARGGASAHLMARSSPTLPVHRVGAYEASYVPSWHAFVRLDLRFRMPDHIRREIGGDEDYGFAVFQLAPGGKADVHAMALRFVTRAPRSLFFPTVHVHDGRVHRTARFDHWLYYQGDAVDVDESALRTLPETAHPLLRRDVVVCRRGMHGKLPNRDTWVALTTVG